MSLLTGLINVIATEVLNASKHHDWFIKQGRSNDMKLQEKQYNVSAILVVSNGHCLQNLDE